MDSGLLELIYEQGWDITKCAVDMNNIIVGTNTIYFCAFENRKYALRIGSSNSGLLSINRNAEEQTIRVMSDIGCAPKIYYFNTFNGNMITEFVEGSTASDKDLSDDNFTSNLLFNLKKMHSQIIDYEFNPYSDIEQRIFYIEKNNIPLHSDFNSIYKRYLDIKNEYPISDSIYRGLCHNDLFLQNIIISNYLLMTVSKNHPLRRNGGYEGNIIMEKPFLLYTARKNNSDKCYMAQSSIASPSIR